MNHHILATGHIKAEDCSIVLCCEQFVPISKSKRFWSVRRGCPLAFTNQIRSADTLDLAMWVHLVAQSLFASLEVGGAVMKHNLRFAA